MHQRVAETYHRGRVVLVGDACHINNPLGGMGMNGGIHDAYNLGAKLTAILHEGADPEELLPLYDRQRRGLAVRFIQEHTIANKALMESTDPDVQRRRQRDFMAKASDPAKAKAFIMERAMIDCVRESYRGGVGKPLSSGPLLSPPPAPTACPPPVDSNMSISARGMASKPWTRSTGAVSWPSATQAAIAASAASNSAAWW